MHLVESGEFAIRRPAGEVMAVIKNPELAARLIPGLSKVSQTGGEYTGEMTVRLGHLSGRMNVRFRQEVMEDGVAIVGRATGLQTVANFHISISLQPRGDSTLVRWTFEGDATGLVATLAPSLVRDALRKTAREVAKNLAESL